MIRYPELYKKWLKKNKIFTAHTVKTDRRMWISLPQNGDVFYINDALPREDQQIGFEVMGVANGESLAYYLNETLYKRMTFPETPMFPLKRGRYTLKITSKKSVDSISFVVR